MTSARGGRNTHIRKCPEAGPTEDPSQQLRLHYSCQHDGCDYTCNEQQDMRNHNRHHKADELQDSLCVPKANTYYDATVRSVKDNARKARGSQPKAVKVPIIPKIATVLAPVPIALKSAKGDNRKASYISAFSGWKPKKGARMCSFPGVDIYDDDYNSLAPGEWLDEGMIDAFLSQACASSYEWCFIGGWLCQKVCGVEYETELK